jgi:hypothetical protein
MTETQQYDRDHVERLLFQVDNMMHARVSNLLLAESIFFVAAAALWMKPILLCILSALGIVITTLFGYTNFKLHLRVNWLIQKFKQLDPLYENYLQMNDIPLNDLDRLSRFIFERTIKEQKYKWLNTGWLYSWGLSGICLIGWIGFFFYGMICLIV